LFLQLLLLAASRACCTAGNKIATKTAIMAMTTSNSIKVKPLLALGIFIISPGKQMGYEEDGIKIALH
jgi:hypothetical protein